MSFINIFNFKKYITKPSDASTARIGHVNAVYKALSQNTLPYKSYVANFSANVTTGTVDVSVIYNDLDPGITITNPSGPGDASYHITSPNNAFTEKTTYSGFLCGDDNSQLFFPLFALGNPSLIYLFAGSVASSIFTIKSSGDISGGIYRSIIEIKVYN